MEWIIEAETLSDIVDHERYTISSKPFTRCRDCKWWEKQPDSLQGRCYLKVSMYPTGGWYCGNAERSAHD